MTRELELQKAIVDAKALQVKAQTELSTLQAAKNANAEAARDAMIREVESLLETLADFSNQHKLDDFTIDAYSYGEYGGETLNWYAYAERNWNASTC